MRADDAENVRARYGERFRTYGYHPKTLGWFKNCQWVRFEAAFEGLHEQDFDSVLDVGCGFGDLLRYLRNRGWAGQYIGIDLVPELVETARSLAMRDPAATFLCGDMDSCALDQPVDMAVSIGVFNHKLREDNIEFVREAIGTMWRLTRRAVVCDFLSTSSEPAKRQDHLYYANPAEIFLLASRFSRRVAIHHAYMPFEFQVKIWHDESYTVEVPVFPPYAHLANASVEFLTGGPLDSEPQNQPSTPPDDK